MLNENELKEIRRRYDEIPYPPSPKHITHAIVDLLQHIEEKDKWIDDQLNGAIGKREYEFEIKKLELKNEDLKKQDEVHWKTRRNLLKENEQLKKRVEELSCLESPAVVDLHNQKEELKKKAEKLAEAVRGMIQYAWEASWPNDVGKKVCSMGEKALKEWEGE
jgi:cell fate (sporulation/competence/biofilm development) regulator YmcA (YheA/YmcA/DUF963 family)